MKKVIVAVLVGVILGIIVGISIGLHAPKWVEEHPGYYVVCTKFLGNIYEDLADKEGNCINNAHASSICWR